MTKEEIAQNVQFLLLPQCFPLLVIGYPFNYGDFLCFDKICSKSSAAELSYEGKGSNNVAIVLLLRQNASAGGEGLKSLRLAAIVIVLYVYVSNDQSVV